MSIQRKLMVILVSITTIPLLLTCVLIVGFEFFAQRDALVKEMDTLAHIAGWNSSAAVVFHDKAAAERMLEGLRAETHIVAACLYEQSGKPVAAYRGSGSGSSCANEAPPDGRAFERAELVLTRPVMLDRDRVGTISLRSDLRKLDSRIYEYLRFIGGILILTLGVTFIVCSRLQRVLANPILDLTKVARIVSEQKDYSVRAPKAGNDELGILVDAFNGMLAQIARHASELTRVNGELVASKEKAEKAAAALAHGERRFRSTFDEAPIGMTLLDSEGAVLECNRTFQEMLGYARGELCAMRLADYTHPEDLDLDMDRFRELIGGSAPRYQLQKRYQTSGGATVWGRVTVSRFRADQGQLLAIAMTEDMSEQKRLEEQFRQAQKMEAIGRLAGGVAHDFNNLLTVIKGNAELLTRRLAADSPMQRNLGQVRKAADRAASLVEQLLAFSRKQFVAPKILDLNAAVREMEKMLRTLIGEDVELTVDAGPEPAWINGDPVQLGQILLNLAVNARDAMPDGGRLTVRTSTLPAGRALPDNVRPGPYVVLSVQDTGIGMTEDVRSHIFEPFFTTKEVGKGTGLGLSTVYGLVQQSGGFIEVETSPGQGSTFSTCLPLVKAAGELAASDSEVDLEVVRGNETVLIAEDEDLVRATLCDTLMDHGYTVLESRTPEHALQLARTHTEPIHLLVTDIVMPRMNGRDLADQVRQLKPDIKVLYISGYTKDGLNLDSDFLRKPFTPQELARAVRAAFEHRQD